MAKTVVLAGKIAVGLTVFLAVFFPVNDIVLVEVFGLNLNELMDRPSIWVYGAVTLMSFFLAILWWLSRSHARTMPRLNRWTRKARWLIIPLLAGSLASLPGWFIVWVFFHLD